MTESRPTQTGSSKVGMLCVLLIALLWTSAPFWWGPQAILGGEFIFADQSHVLTVADDLLAGRILYKDVFYQYGPIPAYSYAAVASIFGNSPLTLLYLQQALSLVVVALAYSLIRSALSLHEAICFTIFGLCPVMLLPGSGVANFLGLDYISFERILLLASAHAWRPPQMRGVLYAVIQGTLLGLLQGVKFGGAWVAGVALIVVDLIYLKEIASDKSRRRNWLRVNLVLLGIFSIIEGGWVFAAFRLLPYEIAKDVLWPEYLLRSYASYNTGLRWPSWQGLDYFVINQLAGVSALFLVIFSGMKCCLRTTNPAATFWKGDFGRFAYLAVFYLFGMMIYFQQVWLFYQYVWALVLAAAWGFHYLRRTMRITLVAFWLPAFAINSKIMLPYKPNTETVLRTFPNGDSLWVDHRTEKRLSRIWQVLLALNSESPGHRGIVCFPEGAGLHHLFGVAHATRIFWFIGALIQTHDEDQFLKDFSNAEAVVVFFARPQGRPPPKDPEKWAQQLYQLPIFSPELNQAMRELLAEPIEIDKQCWIFPLARDSAL